MGREAQGAGGGRKSGRADSRVSVGKGKAGKGLTSGECCAAAWKGKGVRAAVARPEMGAAGGGAHQARNTAEGSAGRGRSSQDEGTRGEAGAAYSQLGPGVLAAEGVWRWGRGPHTPRASGRQGQGTDKTALRRGERCISGRTRERRGINSTYCGKHCCRREVRGEKAVEEGNGGGNEGGGCRVAGWQGQGGKGGHALPAKKGGVGWGRGGQNDVRSLRGVRGPSSTGDAAAPRIRLLTRIKHPRNRRQGGQAQRYTCYRGACGTGWGTGLGVGGLRLVAPRVGAEEQGEAVSCRSAGFCTTAAARGATSHAPRIKQAPRESLRA